MTETDKYQELFERLEKATSALEQIVAKNGPVPKDGAESSVAASSSTSAQTPIEAASDSPKAIAEETDSASIKAFHDLLELYVDPFTSYTQELKIDDLSTIVGYFNDCFSFQLKFTKAASLSKKPEASDLVGFITPLQELLGKINDFKEKNFKSQYYNQLNSISEASNVFNWFLIEPTPLSYIGEIKDSVTFWTNKVLKDFKEKDPRFVEWVKLFLNIFDGLKLYVKQHHTTGLTYASSGDFASNYDIYVKNSSASSSSQTAAATPVIAPVSGGAAPPPPPPPPPADLFDASEPQQASGAGINAVFSQLNQGADITKGLKKVDKSQMTHKNPELRESSIVRSTSAASSIKSNASGKKNPPVPKKPNALSLKPKPEPVIELKDSKWIIKNVKDKHDIKLDVDISQSLFIADSENITIQLTGKINAIQISSVKKLGLVIDSLISEVSIINSKKFGIQILGFVPQFSIDKSDGGEIYLNEKSLNSEIYTTCSTGLNIYIPDLDNEGEFKEVNVPEQFKFKLNEKRALVSETVEHAG